MPHRSVNPRLLLPAVFLVLFAGLAEAQRAGQSMTVQTGRVIGARAVDLQSEAG